MQSKVFWRTKGYIFPRTIRQFYFIYCRISMIIFLCFIILMFVAGIKQESYRGTGLFVAATLSAIYFYCVIVWLRNYRLLKATYCIDHHMVCNTAEKNENISISFQKAVQSEFKYSFNFASASVDAAYVIFANEELGNISSMNIYKAIRKIWKANAVIIPKMAVEQIKGQGDGLKTGDGLREP